MTYEDCGELSEQGCRCTRPTGRRRVGSIGANHGHDGAAVPTPDVVLVVVEGKIEWVSPSVTPLLGWSAGELVGVSSRSLVHPDDLAIAATTRSSRATGEPVACVRFRVRRRDGGWQWMDDMSRPMPAAVDGSSRQRRTVTALVDVQHEVEARRAAIQADAQRRVVQQQLEQSRRLENLGLLAGGIAHDFNNILTAIQASAELAARSLDDPAAVAELLGDVMTNAQRASQLTAQLLDFAGHRPVVASSVSLREAVDETIAMIGLSWPTTVTIDVDIECAVRVLADRSQLRQVLMNLLYNGAQACADRGGAVRITTVPATKIPAGTIPAGTAAPGDDTVVVLVTDDGVGMPAGVVERIFDPFFTTKSTGRGLGLSVVAGIVAAMGGTIDVTSTLGAGTTFRVGLPSGAPG